MHGEIIREDTGTVFIPKSQAPENGWPVIVWNHGTVGIAPTCAPSLTPKNSRVTQYLNTWLSLGFAIVAPDYPGLGSSGLHHYMDERATAWSSLDSIKAALKVFPLSNNIIFIGHSQGAHAAFASIGYQPEYAPELNVLGVVMTGTPYFSDNLLENFVSDDIREEGDRTTLMRCTYIFLPLIKTQT
ncbi:alpha/beta fold hydrolase [Proteus vulgaris]|uniref:alpha/beta fold hydrolase n=1 Tax=Proteus vulgaris TaxID=585 RepID=UPI0034DD0C03